LVGTGIKVTWAVILQARLKGCCGKPHISFFSIISEADVGVRGVDHEDLLVVDGDRLAARFLLPVFDLGAYFLLYILFNAYS